jgi:hypothetical protein
MICTGRTERQEELLIESGVGSQESGVERRDSGVIAMLRAIVGIGINVNQTVF